MINLHTYLLFIGAVVVLVIAPGPDMAYMLTRTIVQGRRAGILAALGINAGAYVHVTAAVLGLTALLAASSVAFTLVKWAGACYLIWIGIQALVSKSGRMNLGDGRSRPLNDKASVPQQLLLLGVTCNVVAIGINLVLVHLASIATAGLRKNRKFVTWLNRIAGTVFIGLGIRLAGEKL